jgi:hypothetical protein
MLPSRNALLCLEVSAEFATPLLPATMMFSSPLADLDPVEFYEDLQRTAARRQAPREPFAPQLAVSLHRPTSHRVI